MNPLRRLLGGRDRREMEELIEQLKAQNAELRQRIRQLEEWADSCPAWEPAKMARTWRP